jgi:hypothetical protein
MTTERMASRTKQFSHDYLVLMPEGPAMTHPKIEISALVSGKPYRDGAGLNPIANEISSARASYTKAFRLPQVLTVK